MFTLLIHSVESPHCGAAPDDEFQDSTAKDAQTSPDSSHAVRAIRGVVHLFRPIPPPPSFSYAAVASGAADLSTPDPSSSTFTSSSCSHAQHSADSPLPVLRSKILFILAVPYRLAVEDLLRFCGPHIDQASEIHIIRNDAEEERYSVLVRFDNQESADSLYLDLNGWRFCYPEPEVCHLLFISSVAYTKSTQIASNPPSGFSELPTCPVCLEKLDQDISGIVAITYDHSFSSTSKWTHLSCLVCQLCRGPFLNATCSSCGISEQLWICLICGFVGCGRYKEGHAREHWESTQHCLSLDPQAQRVWDYVGDKYVHRLNQSNGDGKCRCSWNQYEFLKEEYSQLLSKTLQDQRMHYEALIFEEKQKVQKNMSETVEKLLFARLQDIQQKIEQCTKEKKIVAETNEKLMKEQNLWRDKLKQIEEREKATLNLKDVRIRELEEEIRDFTVFVEAQKSLGSMGGADDIRGGTLLPVPVPHPSPSRPGRPSKPGRRRN